MPHPSLSDTVRKLKQAGMWSNMPESMKERVISRKNIRTGIVCHGRHLEAINWKAHQFGDPEKGLGQVLKTCELAYQKRPEVIVFGTGASEKDGMKEADYTVQYMFDHFAELGSFPQFAGVNLGELGRYMYDHSFTETTSQNTVEEIARAADVFKAHNVDEVILVSNPDHISRCYQLAHNFSQDKKPNFKFFAAQSDVGYNGTTQVTSKIIELPHRGDDPSPNLAGVIGGYFGLSLPDKKEFVDLVAGYIAKHKK